MLPGYLWDPSTALRRSVTRRVLVVVLFLAVPLGVRGLLRSQPQKAAKPTGQISPSEILEKHFTAVGGLESLRALQTLQANGSVTFSVFNSLGDFRFYYRAPASDVLQLETDGQSSIGHDDGTPFFKHTSSRLGGINGVTLNVLEQNWLALIEWEFTKRFVRIELVGLAEVG